MVNKNVNKKGLPFKGWRGHHSKAEYPEWSIDTVDKYPILFGAHGGEAPRSLEPEKKDQAAIIENGEAR